MPERRVLRIDDAGRAAAAREIASQRKHDVTFRRSGWIAEMYEAMEHGGVRVRDVNIDRLEVRHVVR